MLKIPKGPLHIFRECDTVRNSHFSFVFEIVSRRGPPFDFLKYFATGRVLKIPNGPLITFIGTMRLFEILIVCLILGFRSDFRALKFALFEP